MNLESSPTNIENHILATTFQLLKLSNIEGIAGDCDIVGSRTGTLGCLSLLVKLCIDYSFSVEHIETDQKFLKISCPLTQKFQFQEFILRE